MYNNNIIDEDSDEAEWDDTSCNKRKPEKSVSAKTIKERKLATSARILCVGIALIAYTWKYYESIVQTKFWKDYC